jgi:hypothetical protein
MASLNILGETAYFHGTHSTYLATYLVFNDEYTAVFK